MDQGEQIRVALRLLTERCPRLVRSCYWAGTSAISVEELRHRTSFDLDFHTLRALDDVRPILAEIRKAFPGAFETIEEPDDFGGGFRGVLRLPGGGSITIEILSNYEDVPARDLVPSSSSPRIQRVTLARYLADKIQCVIERVEARDLVDIDAAILQHPELGSVAMRLVAEQDALLLCERLLAWTDRELEEDLRAYPGVSASAAARARDLILGWLDSGKGEG